MPGKSKEDTWGAKELTESIKEARSSGKSKHRDRDRDKEREKTSDKDKDRHRERDKERDREKDKDRHRDKDKERHRDKEHDRTRDKDRDRHRDKERDKERDRDRDKHREKEKERRKDRENESSKEKDRERRKDRERESLKEKDKERRKDHGRDSSKEKNRERRKDRERDSSRDKDRKEKDRSKHREKEKDRDREKKERSHDNRERAERTDSGKKERHRDKDEKRREQRNEDGSRDRDKSRTKDEERDRRREEKRHRDKDRERKREKESHDSDREKRKHRDKDGSAERKKRERSGEHKHRKEHREEKDRRKSEYKMAEMRDWRRKIKRKEDSMKIIMKMRKRPSQFTQRTVLNCSKSVFVPQLPPPPNTNMPSEIDNLRRAMAAENEALRRSAESRDSRSQQSSANTRPTTSRTGRTFINFVAAKQREISDQVSQRTKKRGQELMTLIDLDSTGFDIFDMPPVREYDRYIASFGRSNTKQAFVQCNDDNLDRDIQTEEIDKNDRWTQHPQEGSAATGGSNVKGESDEVPLERETNSLQFNRFVENATQLISVLLDEQLAIEDERLEEKDKKERRQHENNHEDEDDVGEEIHNAPESNEQNQEESNQDYAYEDDFEDYDDDFEDDDEEDNDDPVMPSEIDNLRRAMAAENEALRRSAESRDSRSQQSSANTRPTTSRTGRTFINFVAAKQREISDQVSQRTKKRGQELMTLIDLDSTGFDIFDMPPVREYDRYIASFGRSNTKQAFVQCNDDNLDRDIQTEEIDKNDRWTQHPQEGSAATGGSNVKGESDEVPLERETNSLQFNRFVENATQLISVLLDEQLANRVGGKLESNKRSIVFSDGYTLMNTGTPILQGRSIVRVVIHPVQTNLIITMHSMPKTDLMNIDDKDLKVLEKAGLTNRGLLCVWNINEPSRPQKILVLKSVPTTCTFSPSKATMAFCGTVDGSVCVWDLREPPSMHQKCEFGWGHIMVRVPTYSTEAGCPEESHHSRVAAMQPIISSDDAQKATTKSNLNDDSVGFSFQLATVDEKGTISFWVVIEIDKPDDAGSESDLGKLGTRGRVKLIKSSSIQLQIPTRELGPTYQLKVTDMQLLPSNPNHFFVATDAGFISHGARNTERVSPKYFLTNDGVPVGVKCIDFSPFNLPCFLAASGDGSIKLFSTERGTPLVSWPNSTQGMSIVAISWSRSRPSVFFVMDIASKVYVWELLENDSGPVKTEQFTRGRLSALALANDHAATGWGVAGRKPEMIITDNMGSLDVHVLNSRFSSAIGSELDAFSDLLQQLI
ncbi:cytoplasmic dynein 2 intermediate chain 1-like [Lytechinus variegatus]|uniref:cytoplasmic dynein 2 intermediate chain 1-like n=1 Tax=Lytechinus variegatus TaxID=7654 RepID=UPI001BB2BC3E|nr:cytoplasmic dynein 2 intermediate chain 1-like [Lytechinus variegatus]